MPDAFVGADDDNAGGVGDEGMHGYLEALLSEPILLCGALIQAATDLAHGHDVDIAEPASANFIRVRLLAGGDPFLRGGHCD